MKRNKIISILFGILLLIYLFLYANEFEIRTKTNFWIILTNWGIVLILSILILLIQSKWWIKLLFLVSFLGIMMIGIPKTGLWQYSLIRYVQKEHSEYLNFVKEIDKIEIDNLSHIGCYDDEIISRPSLNPLKSLPFNKSICEHLDNLDCVAVALDKSKDKYLFVMSSFIGNGYGLLYCKKRANIDNLFKERIDGLELTNVVVVNKNWYYVSFT